MKYGCVRSRWVSRARTESVEALAVSSSPGRSQCSRVVGSTWSCHRETLDMTKTALEIKFDLRWWLQRRCRRRNRNLSKRKWEETMSRNLIRRPGRHVTRASCSLISKDDRRPRAGRSAAAPAVQRGSRHVVVFFREKKMIGHGDRFKVRENGVELCKLGNGTFCTVQVPVGKHEFVTSDGGQGCADGLKWNQARTLLRPG